MSGIVVAVAFMLGIVAFIVGIYLMMTPTRRQIEAAKQAQLDAIQARATRANYELNQAAFAARRAILDTLRAATRKHDS